MTVGFGRFDEGVENCAGVGARCGCAKEPGFAADDEGTDGVFAAVIVYRKITALGVAGKRRPAVCHVRERCS